jgi:hypothetical protein
LPDGLLISEDDDMGRTSFRESLEWGTSCLAGYALPDGTRLTDIGPPIASLLPSAGDEVGLGGDFLSDVSAGIQHPGFKQGERRSSPGMAAVKIGLPTDYKNNYDAAALLQVCDVGKVVEAILANDDWADMVASRLPKSMGRMRESGRLEHVPAVNAGINVREHIRRLRYIQGQLTRTGRHGR